MNKLELIKKLKEIKSMRFVKLERKSNAGIGYTFEQYTYA